MGYCTQADLIGYLNQFRDEDTTNLDLETLNNCLVRAEGFVNTYLGVRDSLVGATASATPRTVYGSGTRRLSLPPFSTDSEVSVTAPTGYTVPSFILQDGYLVTVDSNGILYPDSFTVRQSLFGSSLVFSSGAGVWQAGVPYAVTAQWGYSSSEMAVLAEATLQTAVQFWRYRDAGGSETVGAEGAITTVRANWTPLVRMGLDAIAQRVRGGVGGIW